MRRQKEETYHPIADDRRKIQLKEKGQKKTDRGNEKKREIRLLVGSFFAVTKLDCPCFELSITTITTGGCNQVQYASEVFLLCCL